jgi:octaprenyl-diphosphate synthase
MIQTQRRFDLNLTVEDYLRIVQMKTGSLFSTAAELAAVISEADPKVIGTFKDFGFQIGTAYQIYDDCVDLAGTESVTGKTLGTDLRKGKFTLPVLNFLRSASEFERERCCQLVLDEKVEEMIELLKNGANNGALNESIAAGSDLIRKAQVHSMVSRPILTPRHCSHSVTRCATCSINFASEDPVMKVELPRDRDLASQNSASGHEIWRSLKSAKCRRMSGRGKSCLHEERTLSAMRS